MADAVDLAAEIQVRIYESGDSAVPKMAYCVEKLDSSGYSINFNKQDHCNLLFLLSDVSAETRENRRKGVFQHNRPIGELNTLKIREQIRSATRPTPELIPAKTFGAVIDPAPDR